MSHPSHEFTSVEYQGATVSSCRHCKISPIDDYANSPCAGNVDVGGLTPTGGVKFATTGDPIPGPSALPPASLQHTPGIPVVHLVPEFVNGKHLPNSRPMTARELVESLDSETLLARLMEAEGEVAALKVLMAAAEAREKVAGKSP